MLLLDFGTQEESEEGVWLILRFANCLIKGCNLVTNMNLNSQV